ncbi:MAG: adenylate/guanylate cyclase domain-containing protein [Pirellulales bacterium]
MAYLVAAAPAPAAGWRRPLPLDVELVVGRTADGWELDWDPHVSRLHVWLRYDGERLHVRRVPEARNPVFFRGRAASEFTMRSGESFVVGSTTLALDDPQVSIAAELPHAATQRREFDSHALRRRSFLKPDERLEVLARLSESLSTAVSDEDWASQLVSLALAGVVRADIAALVAPRVADGTDLPLEQRLQVRHWDRRGPTAASRPVTPPAALLREALQSKATVLHHWTDWEDESTELASDRELRAVDDSAAPRRTWAIAAPLVGDASREWLLYVSGEGDCESWGEGLVDDVKFVELAATTAGRMRETQRWVRRQSALRRFFSPKVLDAIRDQDVDVALAPRETDATVLFCDLRGFSRASEELSDDLRLLLERISEALGVMTHPILAEGGVIGDFHGDAAMGFWGWPLPQHDGAERACRAALAIHEAFTSFASQPGRLLAGFRAGVGIATGRAVAGRIGTVDQVKVTVFGPVVNRASRLETLTKTFSLPLLIDDATANAVRDSLATSAAYVRRVARVVPAGFESPVDVWQLVSRHDYPRDVDVRAWCAASDRAVEAWMRGDREAVRRMLATSQAADPLARWLLEQAST